MPIVYLILSFVAVFLLFYLAAFATRPTRKRKEFDIEQFRAKGYVGTPVSESLLSLGVDVYQPSNESYSHDFSSISVDCSSDSSGVCDSSSGSSSD